MDLNGMFFDMSKDAMLDMGNGHVLTKTTGPLQWFLPVYIRIWVDVCIELIEIIILNGNIMGNVYI